MTLKKKVLAVFLVAAILCTALVSMAGAVNVENFTDVSSSDWFYEYVDFVSKKDYMIGVSETEFAPQNNMTRAMFVTVLSRIDKAEVDNSVSVFDDVPAGTWYTGAVAWAYKNGITTGTSTTTFSPNAPVTREQMSAFIARFVDYYAKENSLTHKSNGKLDAFTDDDQIAAYAKVSVDRARKWGLIIGFPDGSFRPTDYSTRAQVAAVVSRLDWLVNPTGGGGGGYTPIPETTHDYSVKVELIVGSKQVDLQQDYTNVGTTAKADGSYNGDKTLDTIAKDLIADNGNYNNKTNLTNAITAALAKVNGKTETYPIAAGTKAGVDLSATIPGKTSATIAYSGGTATLTTDNAGKISGSITLNVTSVDSVPVATTYTEAIELDTLYNEANAIYAAKDGAYILAKIGVSTSNPNYAAAKAAADKVYADMDPSAFLTLNADHSITIDQTAANYYNRIETIVNDSIDLWKAIQADDTAYAAKIAAALSNLPFSNYGITIGAPDATVAQALGTDSTGTPIACVLNLYSGNAVNTDTTVATATGSTSQTVYTNVLNKLIASAPTGSYALDLMTLIPTIPTYLNNRTGTVNVIVTVTR